MAGHLETTVVCPRSNNKRRHHEHGMSKILSPEKSKDHNPIHNSSINQSPVCVTKIIECFTAGGALSALTALIPSQVTADIIPNVPCSLSAEKTQHDITPKTVSVGHTEPSAAFLTGQLEHHVYSASMEDSQPGAEPDTLISTESNHQLTSNPVPQLQEKTVPQSLSDWPLLAKSSSQPVAMDTGTVSESNNSDCGIIQNNYGRNVVMIGSMARQLLSSSLSRRLQAHEIDSPRDVFDQAAAVSLFEKVKTALHGKKAESSVVVLVGLLEQGVAVTAHWSSQEAVGQQELATDQHKVSTDRQEGSIDQQREAAVLPIVTVDQHGRAVDRQVETSDQQGKEKPDQQGAVSYQQSKGQSDQQEAFTNQLEEATDQQEKGQSHQQGAGQLHQQGVATDQQRDATVTYQQCGAIDQQVDESFQQKGLAYQQGGVSDLQGGVKDQQGGVKDQQGGLK